MINILIVIQARSGSKRLPGKSLSLIEDETMVGHVLNAAQAAARYIKSSKGEPSLHASVVLAIPYGDPLKKEFEGNIIVEGDENDVLSRFETAYKRFHPDYIVRITGDCPLIIPTIISKCVFCAIKNELDYCSNAYEDLRTYIDGFDVEVFSKRAAQWLFEHALSASDKEHVTIHFRKRPPEWARFGAILGHVDLSETKLSVDTSDDLENVRKLKRSLFEKISLAREKNYAVFRF